MHITVRDSSGQIVNEVISQDDSVKANTMEPPVGYTWTRYVVLETSPAFICNSFRGILEISACKDQA